MSTEATEAAAKGRAEIGAASVMSRQPEAGVSEMRQYDSEQDEDELNDLIQDAICDGEGRITPRYLLRHLEKNGYVLMRKEDGE